MSMLVSLPVELMSLGFSTSGKAKIEGFANRHHISKIRPSSVLTPKVN